MTSDEIYTFWIEAYSPDTIPMDRLAEYMANLAGLLGESSSVHFAGLKPGSTKLCTRVEREAVPKVRGNIATATNDPESEQAKRFRKLNELLRSDNAEGRLYLGESNVLNFPGRKTVRPPKLGPFNQAVSKSGVLVRIGGKDRSAHAIIEDSVGQTWSFEVNRDLARELAHHLFGQPLRLMGHGRCFRDEEGEWQWSTLKAIEFSLLDPTSLSDVVDRVRNLPADTWRDDIDPVDLLRAQRDENGKGVH